MLQNNSKPEENTIDRKLCSVAEALKAIPVNREAFYRRLKRGDLPSYNFGRRILVDIEEVIEAMRAQKN